MLVGTAALNSVAASSTVDVAESTVDAATGGDGGDLRGGGLLPRPRHRQGGPHGAARSATARPIKGAHVQPIRALTAELAPDSVDSRLARWIRAWLGRFAPGS
eukprot:1194832-Prorocentrum_minimum.AAC.1